MITVAFHMTIKSGCEAQVAAMAKNLMVSTRAEDPGCITYAFYRRSEDPRELLLFEQWRDQEALKAHIERLQKVVGPPDPKSPYPATHHRSRLPKAFLDLFDKTEALRYDVLG